MTRSPLSIAIPTQGAISERLRDASSRQHDKNDYKLDCLNTTTESL